MTTHPKGGAPDESPEKGQPIVIRPNGEKIQTIGALQTRNSPPTCYLLEEPRPIVEVVRGSGERVVGEVCWADPVTKLALVNYTNANAWKWVSFDETTPKLQMEVPPANPKTQMNISEGTRVEAQEVLAAEKIVYVGPALRFEDENFPELTHVREAPRYVSVQVYSKTRGGMVKGQVRLFSTDGNHCLVSYANADNTGILKKLVSVKDVQPPLKMVIQDAK